MCLRKFVLQLGSNALIFCVGYHFVAHGFECKRLFAFCLLSLVFSFEYFSYLLILLLDANKYSPSLPDYSFLTKYIFDHILFLAIIVVALFAFLEMLDRKHTEG